MQKNISLSLKKKYEIKKLVICAYKGIIIRSYCYIRFLIMNMRILEEIEQYIPKTGKILDVGCGFGLFSFYFAKCSVSRKFISFDISEKRITIAQETSKKLGVSEQIKFYQGDIRDYNFKADADAIVILDLLHHLPPEMLPQLLHDFYQCLDHTNGILLIKEVTTKPWIKMAFTWILDKLVDYQAPIHYYSKDEMLYLLQKHGFDVKFHYLHDILPYPHILYICRKIV